MRTGLSLIAAVAVLSGLAAAQAADTLPWHHTSVARLDQSHPGPAAAAEAGPQKYLHIGMQFNDPTVLQNLEKFRIVDASGTEVGENWGYNKEKSLLVFDGSWTSLNGLYLDGFGHREPLFQEVVAAQPAPQRLVTTRAPVVQQPVVVDPYVYAPRHEVVVNPDRNVYVEPRVDRDVVIDDRNVVVHGDRDVVIDDGYVGGRHVVVDDYDDDHVVVHHHGYHSGGGYGDGGGGSGYDGGSGSGGGYGHTKGKGKHKGAGKGDDSADSGSVDDVTVDDPGVGSAGDAVAKATGINPDKADGSGDGSGSGYGKGDGSGDGSGDGKGDGAGKGDSADAGNAMADASGAGKGDAKGQGDASGQGKGDGSDPASAQGQDGKGDQSSADGQGSGDAQGSGDGPGTGDGSGPGTGSGDGPGCAPGTGDGPGPGTGPGPGPGPGYGPGGPGGPGGYCPYGAYTPYGYQSPYGYYAPYRYNPYMPTTAQPEYKTPDLGRLPEPKPKMEKTPELVLFLTTGDLSGPGKVYQVKGDDGDVLGKVNLPETATGIDMYRDHGVVLASPGNGGKVEQIDDTGKLSIIEEKDPSLPHPVKISMPGNSDTWVAADDMADQLVMGTIAGTKTKVYQKLDSRYSDKPMSVAVANDKGVVFSSDAEQGVHKFMGDQSAQGDKPVLPASGGVAADHSSLRWAAAQAPNAIKVYEGQQYLKSLRLPPNMSFYKSGLMSFGPDGSLCVAVRDADKNETWILCYQVDKEKITNSFKWTHEEIQDFAVGNRMLWNRNSPTNYKSTF